MRFTNLYNLPAPMVAALSTGWAPSPDRISVTALIEPPRIRTLTMKHWDEMEEDVSTRLFALLGQGVHSALTEYAIKRGMLADEAIRVKVECSDCKSVISGKLDLYEKGLISDYKVTSVFSFLLGDKPEWAAQLNVYAFLARSKNLPVTELIINAILRDWTESKTLADREYPKIPFMTVPIELWPPDKCEVYVRERVRLHIKEPMAPCTDAERWGKPNQYAIHKKGNKRALRVLDSAEQAQEWGKTYHEANPKATLEIHERKGEFIRCSRFCNVRNFCEMNEYSNPAVGENNEWEDM